ncbi:MAG: carboxypeptidase-like regulatory domain-containing protein [Candidatus Zixiibacteriota bacterium]|jgi:hypothetical protein
MSREIPRNVEVLIKKAAVDPAFKKVLLSKRARAAEDIGLALEPAEAAVINAVPEDQLRAIINRTKVKPGLRPAFLGSAATAMLAAIGTTVITPASGRAGEKTYGISPGSIPPDAIRPPGAPPSRDPNVAPEDMDLEAEYSVLFGRVLNSENRPISNVKITVSTMEGDKSTTTNAAGEYEIENVRLGCWSVKASKPGYEADIQENIYILKDYKTSVTFVLVKKEDGAGSPNRSPAIDGIRPDRP